MVDNLPLLIVLIQSTSQRLKLGLVSDHVDIERLDSVDSRVFLFVFLSCFYFFLTGVGKENGQDNAG